LIRFLDTKFPGHKPVQDATPIEDLKGQQSKLSKQIYNFQEYQRCGINQRTKRIGWEEDFKHFDLFKKIQGSCGKKYGRDSIGNRVAARMLCFTYLDRGMYGQSAITWREYQRLLKLHPKPKENDPFNIYRVKYLDFRYLIKYRRKRLNWHGKNIF